jgi:signal transduction histidine kinase
MSWWERSRSQISPDRDIFAYDARRAARIAWVLLSISQIFSLSQLNPGIASWQILAISIVLIAVTISLVIEYFTQSIGSFIPTMAAHLLLPVLFASESDEPWISYGLLIVMSIVYMVVMENTKAVVAAVIGLTGLLYFVSKFSFNSISDNVDNSLLNSYFATSWCLIVGIGALIIKISYLKYSGAIESTISKIYQLQLLEKAKLNQLNLRDFENSQLHGTILNTLIAIRNAPHLMKDRGLISQHLRKDLEVLESENRTSQLTIDGLLADLSNSSIQRDLKITLELEPNLELTSDVQVLIREILRELVLNTQKHTSATHCDLKIFSVQYVSNELVDNEIIEKSIVIEASDNSFIFSDAPIERLLEKTKNSESLARLIRNIDGNIEFSKNDDTIIRRVILPMPNDGKYYVQRITNLRSEAIKFVGIGYITLSFIFGVVAFPGYIYLGISKEIIFILMGQFILTGSALVLRKRTAWLAGLGTLFAISIFPIMSLQEYSCSEIQYLPWLFNSIIGSVFLFSMVVSNRVLRWAPAIVFYLACAEISSKLPSGCKHLLDGSTPGILLISLVAAGITYARKRDMTYEERFISSAQREFDRLDLMREKVKLERRNLIAKIEEFTEELDNSQSEIELAGGINALILEIRAFLLLSEYLDNPFIAQLHTYIKDRVDSGLQTYLDINCSEFPAVIDEKAVTAAFNEISSWAGDEKVMITLSRPKDLLLQASLETNEAGEVAKSGHNKNNLSFYFAF